MKKPWTVSSYPILRDGTPDLIGCNAVALDVVEVIRVQVYPEPRLLKGRGKRAAEGKKAADERRRRKGTRGLNEELSQYYPLAENQEMWECPGLLLKGKYGRDHPAS